MATLRIARIEPATRAEGPGLRWALWVQGCSIRCPDCCNPHTWSPNGGHSVRVDDLVESLRRAPVEGVTLLGGEPFDQAIAVAAFATEAQELGRGVMTFTGYRYETLLRGAAPGWAPLLANTDLLVDGPYLRHRPDRSRPWIGSTNQRFIHLTDRYRHHPLVGPNNIELRIRRDGSVALNGWPERALVHELEGLLSEFDDYQ